MRYRYQDLVVDERGDFILNEDVDMIVIRNDSATRQMIEHRLLTAMKDLYNHPQLGNSIEYLLGKRLTAANIEFGRAAIFKALTYDNMIGMSDITVTAIPTSVSNVIYHITIELDSSKYTNDIVVDVNKGIRRS